MAIRQIQYTPYLIVFLSVISCTNEKHQTQTSVPDEFHYDKHKYFDDLPKQEPAILDSILRVADKVEAYNWNGKESNPANTQHHMIDAYGSICASAEKKAALSAPQIAELNRILSDTGSYGDFMPMCFIPHIAFVYYKNDTIIGQTNICFLCSSSKSVPRVEAELTTKATADLKKLCLSLGLIIYDDYDQLPPP